MKQLQKTRGYRQPLLACLIIGNVLLMAGCANERPVTSFVTPTAEPTPVVVETPPSPPEPTPISRCQSDLAALQTVSPRTYAVRKANFDSLLANASFYSGVRGDVNALTKNTVDALYKYKTNQLCAQIGQDLLNGLIRKMESVK
ncbi:MULTISPECIES: hypothetical protein [Serratia]|uniref:Lipoprotein n=1 Tax=Serratia fonticola TaxID=47917 RepID=A0ABY9PJ45_SERFO|nr:MULTISPECIES: hypothetical protein [Serratia]MDQ7211782.1 hypothetical protein [Serratia fonticola]OCJ46126.1 hypothetical protein A6U95_00170 [Serratia sp. 14-2641]OKP15925.1 hypothetical protein BSQ40_29290 [Serratia fonticola]WMT13434.1 hypothetical protein RFB13_19715 [Serratia fonticola]HBE9081893.1 hypothetical protein [Serratia fonticola]